MAWNPPPEVAVARDAAKRLGDADQCVILWIDLTDGKMGVATYGKTRALCADAKQLGDAAYKAVYDFLGQ